MRERELEDFICDNMAAVFGDDAILIGRQVPVVHGRIDILAWQWDHVLIVELKAGQIKEQDIGQVLRYVGDVRQAVENPFVAFMSYLDETQENQTRTQQLAREELMEWFEPQEPHRPMLQPVLIGSGADQNVVAAADGASIDLLAYHLNPDNRTLRFSGIPCSDDKNAFRFYHSNWTDWALKIIELFREHAKKSANREFDLELADLFKNESRQP